MLHSFAAPKFGRFSRVPLRLVALILADWAFHACTFLFTPPCRITIRGESRSNCHCARSTGATSECHTLLRRLGQTSQSFQLLAADAWSSMPVSSVASHLLVPPIVVPRVFETWTLRRLALIWWLFAGNMPQVGLPCKLMPRCRCPALHPGAGKSCMYCSQLLP